MTDNTFNYSGAIEELESIATKLENPEIGLEQADSLIGRSNVLIEQCRAYLRGARQKIEEKD